MAPEIVYKEVSIVCRGNFTPAIFQPFWLTSHQLINKEEAENSSEAQPDPFYGRMVIGPYHDESTTDKNLSGTIL
jgi:hypothetical protein